MRPRSCFVSWGLRLKPAHVGQEPETRELDALNIVALAHQRPSLHQQ